MKIDKEILQFLLIVAMSCLVPYLFASFIQWNLNPGRWGNIERTMTVLAVAFMPWMCLGFWLEKKFNK